jgi:hypothetical protein
MSISGYESETMRKEDFDSNWLRIYIEVDSKMGKWKTVDSSLLTWEFEKITNWLKTIQQGERVEEQLEFIEPNLSFSLLKNSAKHAAVRVHFDLESRPKSAVDEEQYYIDFVVNHGQEFDKLIGEFEMELSKFPIRR